MFTVSVFANLLIMLLFASRSLQIQKNYVGFMSVISVASFTVAVVCFVAATLLTPGYLVKTYPFIDLVSDFLDNEKDLDLLCSYCQLIQSQTSFHCLYCKRCVELFDHHCPYLDNCLGYRNSALFIIFLISYIIFLLSVLIKTLLELMN